MSKLDRYDLRILADFQGTEEWVLEPGDIDEALNAASAVGDDRLQERATGRITPDSFTHGSSAQRVEWFRRGLESGAPTSCDTFQEG